MIRLKNKSQQPVRSVKIELKSAKCRQDILASGQIYAMHMRFKVVEYYAQANVLIFSNCCKIGHFRKNCPQQGESTCKVCSEKYANLTEHDCSGIQKCIHCGNQHQSWNRLGKVKPVRSGRLKNSTGPVRSETGRLESHVQPVKFR